MSTDFENWLGGQAETFGLPEPRTLGPRGAAGEYDQVHLGVGGASYGSVAVGLYGIWRHGGTGVGGTTCDLGLVVSNDGIHFREPVKKHVYISRRDSPVTPVAGKDYPTILCQANGILNVDDETWIYHGRWRNAPVGPEYYGEVALATLPRDRWGAVGLIRGVSEGWVWSAPFRLAGGGGPGLSERRFRGANGGRGVRRRFQFASRLLRCKCRHGLLFRKRRVATEAETEGSTVPWSGPAVSFRTLRIGRCGFASGSPRLKATPGSTRCMFGVNEEPVLSRIRETVR